MGGPHAARIGQEVGGYRLERLIGRGGMSIVFFARHTGTGAEAAVKILQQGLPENIVGARRLEQEARTIARLEHPNVVRTFDSGRTPDGLPYFAMEYLDGEPLSRVFSRHGRVPVPRMLNIVRQMLAALAKAHALDIVHRDIKPDNVFLVRESGRADVVKMLDFGIAKLIGPQPHTAVESVQGVVLGTPEYLSPEVAMDVNVSPASDIYAIGVILFEGLAGRLPFTGRTPTQIAEQHCFTPPPRPREFAPDLPIDLERIVLRCLAKDPAERYRDADALIEAISAFETPAAPPRHLTTTEMPRLTVGDPLSKLEAVVRRTLAGQDAGAVLRPIDQARAQLTALETERSTLERQLADGTEAVTELEHALIDALAESESLAEDTRRLREALRAEARPEGTPLDAVGLVESLIRVDEPARLIDTPGMRLRVDDLLAADLELEAQEERRTGLTARIEELVERRARLDSRCARLEADLLLGRAAETSRQAKARVRFEGLHIEIEAHRQRFARLMIRVLDGIARMDALPDMGWVSDPFSD